MTELLNSIKFRKIDISLHLLGSMLIIVSVYSIWSTSYDRKDLDNSFGKISSCLGSCKFRTPVDYFWLDARGEQSVVDKSLVFTPGQSKATIILNSGSRLTLYPNSLVQITANKKGASIDIIEGKVNFEKSNNSKVSEKLTIKGKEIPNSPDLSLSGGELSVTPELLIVESPEKVFLKGSDTPIKIVMKNGRPPFRLKIEDFSKTDNVTTEKNEALIKISHPGILGVHIQDSEGQSTTKMIQIEDLRLPSINIPKNGDIVYSKNFTPIGEFDPVFTEFRIKSRDKELFLGPLDQLPKNLPKGDYFLSARIKKGEHFSDWTSELKIQIVQTVLPQIDFQDKMVFFNRAPLSWKKSIPAIHKLIIRDLVGKDLVNLTANIENYNFESAYSGRFNWLVEPLFNDSNEKSIWRSFYLINPQTFLNGPEDKKVIVSEDLVHKVDFSWKDVPLEISQLTLEIRAKDFKKVIDVTGLKHYEVELPVLKNYRWKILFTHSDFTQETPELTFKIDAPPPMESIRSEEILIKD